MKELAQSNDILLDGEALRSRLSEDGYLYFRKLLPADGVRSLREVIAAILKDSLWLAENGDSENLLAGEHAVGAGTHGFHGTYTAIQMRQEFHEFAVQPALTGLAERVLGEPVFCHLMRICRITPPTSHAGTTPAHQDYRLIQGCADTLTTWIPLADVPPEAGGLQILQGSHKFGVASVEAVDAPGGVAADVPAEDPRWRSTSYTAGDVLMFPSLTMHGGLPNTSDKLRLSADFRYQPVNAPVSDYDGSFKPHHFPRVPDWPTITRGWTSTASVQMPAELRLVPRFDRTAPEIPVPASRFL